MRAARRGKARRAGTPTGEAWSWSWAFSLSWDLQDLAREDLVGILELVPVGFEDAVVLVGIAVVLLADLRERIALLDGVAPSARGGGRARAGHDRDLGVQVRVGGIDGLDLIPDLVLRFFRRRLAAKPQLAAVEIHRLDLHAQLVHE